MHLKTPINILVTAIGGGGHGDQILKALLLSKNQEYRIFGADANPDCPQFRLVEKAFVLPFANDPTYLKKLLELCKILNIRVLFHGHEAELKLFSQKRHEIESQGIFLPINSARVIDICMDKLKTAEFLSNNGFNPPKYNEIRSNKDFAVVDYFPVVVKPSVGGGGSANCYIAQNLEELRAIAILLNLESHSQKFMVQEYVGTPDHEYTVGVLHDMDGSFINSIALKRSLNSQLNIRLSVRNRTNKNKLGDELVISSGISHGHIGHYSAITEQCEALTMSLGVKGPLNIQCRFVDGEIKVYEINPRFSGTTSIRAMMGFNEPEILINSNILGKKIKQRFPYKTGSVIRTLKETVIENSS